jgi:glycerol-3-phosphate acyltransferase PlsX
VHEGGVIVALDAFGAERGAAEVADAASKAASAGIRVRVFGDPAELGDLDGIDGVEVHAAAEWISNDEEPVRAVRSKPGASVVMAAADVAAGDSDALVSAGVTGAVMTAALFALRRLRGVQRPALAVHLPVPGKPVLLLDAGANVEVRPQHLIQFAFLGSVFSQSVLGVERPRVALLSVGEEQGKGTPGVVAAHRVLAAADGIRFVGNVEGRDVPAGVADVVVTDGFTGNVALKLMEGTARAVGDAVRQAARSNPVSAAGGLLLRPALSGLRRELDPNNTGGAVMLGLRRVAVVAHGNSSAEGIANAVRLAERAVRERAPERMAELLDAAGATRGKLGTVEGSAPADALADRSAGPMA